MRCSKEYISIYSTLRLAIHTTFIHFAIRLLPLSRARILLNSHVMPTSWVLKVNSFTALHLSRLRMGNWRPNHVFILLLYPMLLLVLILDLIRKLSNLRLKSLDTAVDLRNHLVTSNLLLLLCQVLTLLNHCLVMLIEAGILTLA